MNAALPNDFPSWQTVSWWFRRFVRRLRFRTIHDIALLPGAPWTRGVMVWTPLEGIDVPGWWCLTAPARGASTLEVSPIGLDLARNVYQVPGAAPSGAVVPRKRSRRDKVLSFFAGLPPCTVAMEACGGAPYWAREIAKAGPTVRLIPAAHVKPFVKRRKNDAADAEAICEAARRPRMRFVAVKSAEQRASAVVLRARDLVVRQRDAVLRLLRGAPLELVARELAVTAADLSGWRDAFLDAGSASLKSRARDDRDETIDRLRTKVGALTMDTELLSAKIERLEGGGGPFAARRSKR